MDKRIKDLKNKYEQIDIPENIDEVIDKAHYERRTDGNEKGAAKKELG